MVLSDLFKPRWKHSKRIVRIAAIEKVTDQLVLVDIVKKDKDFNVRGATIDRISDKMVLAEIAKND